MLIIIMVIAELINIKIKKNHDYLLIVTAIALAIVQIIKHVGVFNIMLSLLVFPIFISTFTFERRKIIVAFIISLISLFLLVYWISYKKNIYIDVISTLTVSFILLTGAYLSLTITMRGKKILSELETAMITEQELLIRNAFIEKASKMDLMTSLYNHATFHLHLEGLIEQAKNIFFPLQLAILDIDDFKSINDQYGHKTGDVVINRIANCINDHIVQNDFAARYGGEEFVIIFAEKTLHEALEILEEIRACIYNMHFTEINTKKVSVSIGISNYTYHDTKDSLFKRADRCLYTAKNMGKNTVIADINSLTSNIFV